jgi:hypothetical protein
MNEFDRPEPAQRAAAELAVLLIGPPGPPLTVAIDIFQWDCRWPRRLPKCRDKVYTSVGLFGPERLQIFKFHRIHDELR